MKKQLKKWTALLLCVAMVFVMAGCGNAGDGKDDGKKDGQKQEDETKLTDTTAADVDEMLAKAPHFNITVMLGSFTDSQGVETKKALEYIEEHFNVTFNYVETSNTTENTIAAIETAVASDTDGIIGACVKTAACVQAAGDVPMVNQPDIGEAMTKELAGKENYLGSVCEDDYAQGYAAGKALYEAGCRKVCIARMTVGISESIDNRGLGFLDFVAEHDDMELLADNQSRGQYADAVATFASAFPEMDGIFCVIANDGVSQAMVTEGLVGSVKLATVGYASPDKQLLENGTLVYCTGGKAAITMTCFLALYNHLLDESGMIDGETKLITRNSMEIKSVEDFEAMEKYVVGDVPPYNAEEMMNMVHYFNEEFTAGDFAEICNNYTIDDLMSRRSK